MVGDHPAGVCWRIRGPPPRHRPAYSAHWEQEGGPPPPDAATAVDPQHLLSVFRRCRRGGPRIRRTHPPSFVVVRRPVGELGCCRGDRNSVPPARLSQPHEVCRAASVSLLLRFLSVAHSRSSRGRRRDEFEPGARCGSRLVAHGECERLRRERSESPLPATTSGPRVVTGKSAARITAPERHDGLTIGTTSEREVESRGHHGDARARLPVVR